MCRGTCPELPRLRPDNMQQSRPTKYLRQRADEARALADLMRSPLNRLTMWNLACRYDLLARHAEAHEERDTGDTISRDRK